MTSTEVPGSLARGFQPVAFAIGNSKQRKREMDFSKMNVLFETLDMALNSKPSQPVLIWGMDGCGKSRGVESYIRQNMSNADGSDVKYWFLNGNSMDTTDIPGLFARGEDGEWGRVPVLRAIKEAVEEQAKGNQYVFIFEEFTTMNKAVMAPFLSLVSEKVAGDLRLDENLTHIIALANPPEIAVNPTHLAPPVSTRFLHLDWKMDFAYWSENMMEGNWFPGTQEAAADVISYLVGKCNPDSPSFDETSGFAQAPYREFMNKTRGNPRTWTNLIKADSTARECGASLRAREIMFRGMVGEGPGREYASWLRMQADGLDVIAALKDPFSVEIPTRTDRQFAFFNAVAARVSMTMDPDDFYNAWELLSKTNDRDLAVLPARTLGKLLQKKEGPKLIKGKGLHPTVMEYGEMLMGLKAILANIQQ